MFKKNSLPKTLADNPEIDDSRLAALLNSLSDGVLAINDEGIIVLTNGAILNLLNQNSLAGVELNKAIQLVDASGHSIDIFNLLRLNPSGYSSRDLKLKFLDGSSINLFISVSPVVPNFADNSNSEKGFVIVLRDITKEKIIEQERDEFVSVAGHELRTPVAIAEGSISNARLLAEKSGSPEAVLHTLETAHNQILFLSNMINDLAMLSKAERGKEATEIKEFNVSELIGLIADDYRPQAVKKNLNLIVKIDPKITNIRTSQLYLREIIQNFITNSLKYTLSGMITLSVDAAPKGIYITVSDTGIGINQAEQKKLFQKFFRSEDSRVKKENGTGLGLYVTSKLIKILNGQLNMHSELNKGTAFKIYIPNLVE
jgi:two-component system, OmpR family, phosphate regulon sensor histidine kinase PhoR